jgi:hypothetical protein
MKRSKKETENPQLDKIFKLTSNSFIVSNYNKLFSKTYNSLNSCLKKLSSYFKALEKQLSELHPKKAF